MPNKTPIFTTHQRWIYVTGLSLKEALNNLAEAIPTITTNIPTDEQKIIEDTAIIKVYKERDGFSNDIVYRVGMCVSWKRASPL